MREHLEKLATHLESLDSGSADAKAIRWALDEMLGQKIALGACVDGGSYDMLRAALSELTGACEVEFTSDQTDDEPDDEPVGGGQDEAGQPTWMGITFGMIRRARAALGGCSVTKTTSS